MQQKPASGAAAQADVGSSGGSATGRGRALRSRLPRSKARRVAFVTIYIVFVAVLGWLGLRVIQAIVYDVPVFRRAGTDVVLRHYYPELWESGLMQLDSRDAGSHVNVVLLGASVLQQVAERLTVQLEREMARPVRVFDLTALAHTTRDSLIKYQHIGDRPIDLIIWYHGINDARMNCTPDAAFRADYTHCFWYYSLQRHLEAGKLFPIDVKQTGATLIPPEVPQQAFIEFGRTIKTAEPFRSNLELIVQDAQRRGRLVLVMTFAYHQPDDYTLDRFKAGTLDYGPGERPYKTPTELWGKPEHVLAAITTHNRVIREVAARHDKVIFVDQEALLSKSGSHFADVCHLTSDGIATFVDHAAPAVVERIEPPTAMPGP